MLSFTRKNGQLSFYLAHKLYKNGPKKGTVPEKINSHDNGDSYRNRPLTSVYSEQSMRNEREVVRKKERGGTDHERRAE